MTIGLFATGIALGLMVSVPPGPNTALCINLACDGVRKAVPVITCAALADAAYSLMAASGILIVSQAGTDALAWLTPCFMLGTAVLAWSPALISSRAASPRSTWTATSIAPGGALGLSPVTAASRALTADWKRLTPSSGQSGKPSDEGISGSGIAPTLTRNSFSRLPNVRFRFLDLSSSTSTLRTGCGERVR